VGVDPRLAYAVADIGRRYSMEDEHVLQVESVEPIRVLGAVFDGHGGADVARLAKVRLPELFLEALPSGPEDALRTAFAGIHRESEGLHGGAAAAAFYLDDSRVTVANAGDSQIVAVSEDRATTLTEEHRITNEMELARVVEAGATIWGPYVCLPSGAGIMPTRTLGDHEFASVGVIPEPVVSSHILLPGFLVAACDGMWEVIGAEELPSLLKGATSAENAARSLHHEALHARNTEDNLTILVVKIS